MDWVHYVWIWARTGGDLTNISSTVGYSHESLAVLYVLEEQEAALDLLDSFPDLRSAIHRLCGTSIARV